MCIFWAHLFFAHPHVEKLKGMFFFVQFLQMALWFFFPSLNRNVRFLRKRPFPGVCVFTSLHKKTGSVDINSVKVDPLPKPPTHTGERHRPHPTPPNNSLSRMAIRSYASDSLPRDAISDLEQPNSSHNLMPLCSPMVAAVSLMWYSLCPQDVEFLVLCTSSLCYRSEEHACRNPWSTKNSIYTPYIFLEFGQIAEVL